MKKQKRAQMRIQQMAFMIVAVVLFFILVGLFFINWQFKDIKGNFAQAQKQGAISSMSVVSDMVELNCDSRESFCLDEDKLIVMSKKNYGVLWPVESVEVYKIYPRFDEKVKCPDLDCNYYDVYDSKQKNTQKYSTFVSICKKIRESGNIYEKCEIGKLVLGVKVLENDD